MEEPKLADYVAARLEKLVTHTWDFVKRMHGIVETPTQSVHQAKPVPRVLISVR